MKIESKELGKYGDPIGQKICGVETDSFQLLTRLHQWQIQKITVDTEPTERRSAKRPSGSDNGSDHEAAFAAQPPWSSVNNCTYRGFVDYKNKTSYTRFSHNQVLRKQKKVAWMDI
jgi:hypothetical protein